MLLGNNVISEFVRVSEGAVTVEQTTLVHEGQAEVAGTSKLLK